MYPDSGSAFSVTVKTSFLLLSLKALAESLIYNLFLPSSVPFPFAPSFSSSSSTTSSYFSSSSSSYFTLSVGTPVSETSVPFGSCSPSTSICCYTKRLTGVMCDPGPFNPSFTMDGLIPFSGALKFSSS